MKIFFKFFVAITTVAILFSSCGKSADEGKMIPSNAMFVSHINTKSLLEKVTWDDIKQTSWFKKASSDSSMPEWRKKILDNPSASGIDFDKGLVFFAQKGAGDLFYLVVQGSLKSEKDFEQFNKNFDPSQTIKKEGDINLLALKDKHVVGWNEKYFVYAMNSATPSGPMSKWNDNSSLQPDVTSVDHSAELSVYCTKLFSLKSDSSLAHNEKFADLLKENGDVHVWQNTEEMFKSTSSMGALGMLKLDAFFQGNVSTYTVNFDKGKIEVKQKGYASKELTDIMKKNLSGNINTGMIKDIPSKNVFAVFAANFKPQGIVDLIKLTGTDGFVNSYAQQMGFTLDDFSKSTNGDLLLAFTDFKLKADSFNYKDNMGNDVGAGKFNKPEFNYIFAVGVGDKASLQKIIASGKKVTSQLGKDSLLNDVMTDKTFALSNSNDFAKQYLAGGNNSNFDFTDKISGHPVGLFIDIHKILTELSSEKIDNPNDKFMFDQSLKMWNNVIMTGGDYTNGAFTANTVINLVDGSTNSLKQLNTYVDQMYKLNEEKRAGNLRENKLDSLLTPPPIDTVKVK